MPSCVTPIDHSCNERNLQFAGRNGELSDNRCLPNRRTPERFSRFPNKMKMNSSGYASSNSSSHGSSCTNDSFTTTAQNHEGPSRSTMKLSGKQVSRLRAVLDEEFEVHGRGNFPTLKVRLVELVSKVRRTLEARRLPVSVTKMNGGAASHILAAADDFTFLDLDLIFNVCLADAAAADRVRDCVLEAIADLLPDGCNRAKIDAAAVRDAYVRKMVKVDDAAGNGDRWSLFSLNNHYGRSVELKFVDRMRRQFEFSVDSFQIRLDPLLDQEQCYRAAVKLSKSADDKEPEATEEDEEWSCIGSGSSDCSLMTSSTASDFSTSSAAATTVTTSSGDGGDELDADVAITAESVYGDIRTALRHLNERLIDTKQPEQIRGGGLLKYCHLLVRGYRPARVWKARQQERYMCSRFFIDFADLASQEIKLRGYLDNHLATDDQTKYDYLLLLYRVVAESTVCLMQHERRETLAMIDRLIYQLSINMYHREQMGGVCYNVVAAVPPPPPQAPHQPKHTLFYLPRDASYWIPVV